MVAFRAISRSPKTAVISTCPSVSTGKTPAAGRRGCLANTSVLGTDGRALFDGLGIAISERAGSYSKSDSGGLSALVLGPLIVAAPLPNISRRR
jgi:hypothetical protein